MPFSATPYGYARSPAETCCGRSQAYHPSSVRPRQPVRYSQVTSEYQAADAAIKGELLEKIAAGDASVAESLNSRIDNEVSTLAASFEDRIRESESALNEAIVTGDASLNIEIN